MGGNPEREPPFFFMKPADSAFSATEFGENTKTENEGTKHKLATCCRYKDPLPNILLELPL